MTQNAVQVINYVPVGTTIINNNNNMEYVKKDDITLQVVKPVEIKEETNEYKLDFLKNQEIAILKQKNDFIEARDKELLEVRELIAQCEGLGIKSEVAVALEVEQAKEAELVEKPL